MNFDPKELELLSQLRSISSDLRSLNVSEPDAMTFVRAQGDKLKTVVETGDLSWTERELRALP